MKIIIDSINYDQIKAVYDYFPIDGVTCNPTILARNNEDPYVALKKVRELIGQEKELHVQVISDNVEGMIKEAERITAELGTETFIKVPVNSIGLKAISTLTELGYNVTATAVYNQMQGILAVHAGAKYVAPYYNRIENMGYDALEVVMQIQNTIMFNGYDANILGASFKNSKQVVDLISNGIGAVTIAAEMFSPFVEGENVTKSIADFKADFENLTSVNKTMADCD